MSATSIEPPLVLIVEDDFLVRMDTAEMVKRAGFRVIEAGDADEAIRLLGEHSDIAAIFTDVEMPGSMNGLRLAHAVRDRWPPIKIIATSAHLDFRESDLPEGGRFFPKPYIPAQVTDALRELTKAV